MTGFEAYKIYHALIAHFREASSYNAVKYNFHSNCNEATFRKRPDRWLFDKIGRKYGGEEEVKFFFISNILKGITWPNKMTEENFNEYMLRISSLEKFEIDLLTLSYEEPSFDEVCKSRLTLDLLLTEEISIHSVTIIDILVDYLKQLKKSPIMDDPLLGWTYKSLVEKIEKYKSIFRSMINKAQWIDIHDQYKNTIIKVFTN